jgi:membrane protein required for colicin V production
MNPLDLGVIAIIVLSAIFAFARGFVREALSIIAWVGAAAITVFGFSTVLIAVSPIVNNALLAQLIAGFGLFVISLIVLTIVTGLLARMVRSSALSPIDRTLGFIFGLARGAFLVCLAYLLLDITMQPTERPVWVKEAKSAPFLEKGASELRRFLPESLKLKNAAVDEVIHALTPAAEAQKAMRALQNPSGAPDTTVIKPNHSPTYRPAEKRELDRVIGTQR